MIDAQQAEKRFRLLLELRELVGSNLVTLRTGALLYQAQPDLGRFLIDITTPTIIDDPDAGVLNESAIRFTAADDNYLQGVIESIRMVKEKMED